MDSSVKRGRERSTSPTIAHMRSSLRLSGFCHVPCPLARKRSFSASSSAVKVDWNSARSSSACRADSSILRLSVATSARNLIHPAAHLIEPFAYLVKPFAYLVKPLTRLIHSLTHAVNALSQAIEFCQKPDREFLRSVGSTENRYRCLPAPLRLKIQTFLELGKRVSALGIVQMKSQQPFIGIRANIRGLCFWSRRV